MIEVFLSYARGDGLDAAAKLRAELTGMGFQVWRDLEEMQGGLTWKKQLYQALGQVDAVLILLTPAAAASQPVTWEWETALTMEKRVIPLLVATCDVPAELRRLHYHDLSAETGYTLGLAHLARDLIALAQENKQPLGDKPQTAGKYVVGTNICGLVGDNGIVVNQTGGTLNPASVARIVAALRARQGGLPDAEAAELRLVLDDMLRRINVRFDRLDAGQERILGRFDQQEQRILTPILARLDSQQAEQTAAILDALDTRTFPADELGRHLAAIQMALAEISIRAEQIGDRQLAESARRVTELASAPGLDVKHKLKVTIPIVPVLLSYEGAFELGSRLNLEEAWRAVRGWNTGG